uniref:Uncharacterized protein n=1 Tax=Cyprinus carpio TaxID=7962 RepID=A0A8C2KTQ8_CYPCA
MSPREDAPADRGCFVGIIFFILGLGTLLPWNFFMTASMYFNNRLNTSEWSNGTVTTRKEYYFDNWMTLLSQLPLLLFTLLNSFLYGWISEKMRIAGSLVFILFFFILTAVLVKISMEEDRFFSVTMATIWFINSFGAVLQGSLFGLVGLLPQKYSAVFMSGQGLAGTFAAFAMIFAIASETLCYFTIIEILLYAHSMQLSQIICNSDESSLCTLIQCKPVLQPIWLMAFCVTFVFTVTLSVFPAITVDVKTVYGGKWERYFIPVFCFLFFNMMDFTGRTVTVFFKLVEPKDAETAGALMTFFLALGLSLGAALSFPLRFLV